MMDPRSFQVALRRVMHDGKKRTTMQRTVALPFAPSVGLELRFSDECTFVFDQVWYSLETGTFGAVDRAQRAGPRRGGHVGLEPWQRAGFDVLGRMREQRPLSRLRLVTDGSDCRECPGLPDPSPTPVS